MSQSLRPGCCCSFFHGGDVLSFPPIDLYRLVSVDAIYLLLVLPPPAVAAVSLHLSP